MEEYNYKQRFTVSRYQRMETSVIFAETFLSEVFHIINLKDMFSNFEKIFILRRVNKMVLNSIPFDFEEFINYKDFSSEGDRDITLTKDNMNFLREEESRYFLVFEAIQGHTLLETLYD